MITRLPKIYRYPYLLLTMIFPLFKDTLILVAEKDKDWEPNLKMDENEFKKILNSLGAHYNN